MNEKILTRVHFNHLNSNFELFLLKVFRHFGSIHYSNLVVFFSVTLNQHQEALTLPLIKEKSVKTHKLQSKTHEKKFKTHLGIKHTTD